MNHGTMKPQRTKATGREGKKMLYNPRPHKEYAEETPGRPVLIDGYWHIEWTPARTGHQAITPYGWPTKEQAERAIAAHK